MRVPWWPLRAHNASAAPARLKWGLDPDAPQELQVSPTHAPEMIAVNFSVANQLRSELEHALVAAVTNQNRVIRWAARRSAADGGNEILLIWPYSRTPVPFSWPGGPAHSLGHDWPMSEEDAFALCVELRAYEHAHQTYTRLGQQLRRQIWRALRTRKAAEGAGWAAARRGGHWLAAVHAGRWIRSVTGGTAHRALNARIEADHPTGTPGPVLWIAGLNAGTPQTIGQQNHWERHETWTGRELTRSIFIGQADDPLEELITSQMLRNWAERDDDGDLTPEADLLAATLEAELRAEWPDPRTIKEALVRQASATEGPVYAARRLLGKV